MHQHLPREAYWIQPATQIHGQISHRTFLIPGNIREQINNALYNKYVGMYKYVLL
jgi:hypothetical protein